MSSRSVFHRANDLSAHLMKSISVVVLLSLMLAGQPATRAHAATIYRVAPGGLTSGACGSDFGSNACDLQYALSIAIAVDELWVLQGRYVPTSVMPYDQTISFVIPPGVGVYGGFDGAETLLTERDWVSNVTILSGDLDSSDVDYGTYDYGTWMDISGSNSYHVVRMDGTSTPVTSSTVLDGFTITAGSAAYAPAIRSGGGLCAMGRAPAMSAAPPWAISILWATELTCLAGAMMLRCLQLVLVIPR